MEKKITLSYKLGKEHLAGLSLTGWVPLLFSIGAYYNIGLAGLLFVIPGCLLLTITTGTIVDPSKRRFKEYVWVMFMRIGRWYPFDEYEDIIVLSKNKTLGYNFNLAAQYQTATEYAFEIYVTSHKHLEKTLLCRIKDKETAYREAHKLGELLGFEVAVFNPGGRWPRRVLTLAESSDLRS